MADAIRVLYILSKTVKMNEEINYIALLGKLIPMSYENESCINIVQFTVLSGRFIESNRPTINIQEQ